MMRADNPTNPFDLLPNSVWPQSWVLYLSPQYPYYERIVLIGELHSILIRTQIVTIKRPEVTTRPGDDIFSLTLTVISTPEARQLVDQEEKKKTLSEIVEPAAAAALGQSVWFMRFFTESDFNHEIQYFTGDHLWRCSAIQVSIGVDQVSSFWLTAEMSSIGIWSDDNAAAFPKDWYIEYDAETAWNRNIGFVGGSELGLLS